MIFLFTKKKIGKINYDVPFNISFLKFFTAQSLTKLRKKHEFIFSEQVFNEKDDFGDFYDSNCHKIKKFLIKIVIKDTKEN